jgi:lysophospholipase L1-like esterase
VESFDVARPLTSRRLATPLRPRAFAALALLTAALGVPATTPAGAVTLHYAAMGDSFAAGEGAPANSSGFDTGSGDCHRSSLAASRVFAAAKGLSMTATNGARQTTSIAGHIACSGAGATQITARALHGEAAQVAQLRALNPAPDLITLTVGAGDVRMDGVQKACRVGTGCAQAISQARTIARTRLAGRLRSTYATIKARTPRARLIVVGYPRLYNTGSQATAECVGLPRTALTELEGLARDLEAATIAAARTARVEYLSMLNVLAGRELCTANPLINGVQVTGGQLEPQSGHPNAQGHLAIANRMSSYLTRYPTAPAWTKVNRKPLAAFTFRRVGTTNQVLLDGSASKDLDGLVQSWVWTADGEVIGRGRTATVSLSQNRRLVVRLTVTDNRGARGVVSRVVSARSTLPS